jgi:hypothetical protein
MLDNWGYRHTLRICNTYCFSTATVDRRTRLSVTLYVHCLSCWLFRFQIEISYADSPIVNWYGTVGSGRSRMMRAYVDLSSVLYGYVHACLCLSKAGMTGAASIINTPTPSQYTAYQRQLHIRTVQQLNDTVQGNVRYVKLTETTKTSMLPASPYWREVGGMEVLFLSRIGLFLVPCHFYYIHTLARAPIYDNTVRCTWYHIANTSTSNIYICTY